MAILAITVGAAIPSFKSFIQNNLLTTETNRFIADLQLARSEALKRNNQTILCRSADPAAANPTCGGAASNWATGWLLFASADANTTYDAGADTLIKASEALPGSLTLNSNAAASSVLIFNGDASTNQAGATARFAFCDQRGNSSGRQVEIPPTGKPRIAAATSNCTNPT